MQMPLPDPKKDMNKTCNKFGNCPEKPSKIFAPARDNAPILFIV